MRNLSLFGCVLALLVSSGCQSGSYGFRNPFKDQFARTFPNSFPELLTKSKESESENRGVYDLGGEAVVDPNAGMQAVSDSQGLSDLSGSDRSPDAGPILERGDAAYAAGHLQQAAGFYQEALALDPDNVHAHHRLAILYDQQQDYATSERHYEAALKSDPENVSILNDLGYSYYLQNRFNDSKAYLEFIRKIKPDNSLAMRNLALVHAAEGDLQQAYELFQQGGLNPEQSQQQIQQAVARVNEGKATTGSSRMGIASTSSEPQGTSSVQGFASVQSEKPVSASSPGRAGTQSPQGTAFQPRPDWGAAYGLSADQPTGRPDPSAPTEAPASQSLTEHTNSTNLQPALAQQQRPEDYGVERVSYTPPLQQYESSASEDEIIRTALNTGYGNLFPVISPEDYYRTRRDVGVDNGPNARNAHYEEFGPQESNTPHVVHADSNRPANADISPNNLRSVSYEQPRASSYGSPRIQSPSDRSDQQGSATSQIPANRFPVTESKGQIYQNSDYSRFPKPDQPSSEESSGSTHMMQRPDLASSGLLIVPKSGTSVPQQGGTGTAGVFTHHSPPGEKDSDSYDDGPRVSPMSEAARKAHELALERYRSLQQQ